MATALTGQGTPHSLKARIREHLSPWILVKGEDSHIDRPPVPRWIGIGTPTSSTHPPQSTRRIGPRGWLPTEAGVCPSLWALVQQASNKNPAEHPEPRVERDARLSRHHRRGHAEEDTQVLRGGGTEGAPRATRGPSLKYVRLVFPFFSTSTKTI